MALDYKKLRVFNTFESCEMCCLRSNVHRDPVQLKNGRWAAMTFNEKYEYKKLREGITFYANKHRTEVAEINKSIKEYRAAKKRDSSTD